MITDTDMLCEHADAIDPPETVESLRAEIEKVNRQRESLWQEKMERQSDVPRIAGERDSWKLAAQSERRDANAAQSEWDDAQGELRYVQEIRAQLYEDFEALRSDLDVANAEIARLRATHVEAEAAGVEPHTRRA